LLREEKSPDSRALLDPDLLSALEPIPRVDLTEEVVRRFKALLADGKLKPGGRLPAERDLAVLFGISRPSLRHGLKALELMGAIESRRRHGTFVTTSAAKVLDEPLHFAVLLNSSSFEELYEVRRIVEVELAALAAQRASPAELDEVERCLAQQKASVNVGREFLQKDLEFHNLIARASHNALFATFLGGLRTIMSDKMRVLLESPHADVPQSVHSTLDQHAEIVRRLRARNAAGARKAMLHHLEAVYGQWLSLQGSGAAAD
jgi:GntR family transcriptional regulator, transcriptional repressor for pyruvate dehydrogenase complex